MIPWKEVSAAVGKILILSQETQKNKADIKSLDEKVDNLSKDVKFLETEITQLSLGLQRVYYETQRLQDEIRRLREDNERRDKDNEYSGPICQDSKSASFKVDYVSLLFFVLVGCF